MVYDCFTFFNELDLLEIRLYELDSVVDKFVLVEATRTFTKKPKPLYFEENKQRFEKFLPKIVHIKVNSFPGFLKKFRNPNSWDYENHQREQIILGLAGCQPDDIIIVSDVDEIPNRLKLGSYKPGINVFEQNLFYYYLNCICKNYNNLTDGSKAQSNQNGFGWWKGSVMLPYSELKKIGSIKKTRLCRDKSAQEVNIIANGGWHYSFMGGKEAILLKLRSWSHFKDKNYNFLHDFIREPEKIDILLSNGVGFQFEDMQFEFISIRDNAPGYVIEHADRFQHLIKDLS